MPINAGYEYFNAEKKYLAAQTLEEQISCLEEMIRAAPKHKSSENFVANLKQRLIKLNEKKEKASKKKTGKKGIKKEGFQFVLVGKTNSGKSLLLSKITNAKPFVSEFPYSTKSEELRTFNYTGVKAQIVDMPSVGSEFFDVGIIHTADCLLVVIEKIEEIEELKAILERGCGKRIFVFNKIDLLTENEKRKLSERIKSKKINAVMVSSLTSEGVEELKEKMFKEMKVIRIYTKEPGKEHSKEPMVLRVGSNVKDAAEGIRKGFSNTIRESRVTGPSSKFPNQKVGLSHELKDLDIVEFHTR
jgi:uncharacterized protein